MSIQLSRITAMIQKETYHIMRDPFTLALSIGLPIFMVFIFGFAIEFNVKNIPIAVFDADKNQMSRRLVENFGSSDYFIINTVTAPEAAEKAILSNHDRGSLIIPGHFQRDLFAGRPSKVQILLDGSDNSTVIPVIGYVERIQQIVNHRLANYHSPIRLDIRNRLLFNPELNSRWFVIPGLTVVVMGILSILLTCLTVAREWENGSMELLLSTPVLPIEIIIGKLTPYAILGIGVVGFIYIISRVVFQIPFQGSLWVFGLGAVLFLVTYLSQGVLISVLTRSQQLAMQFGMLSGLLPAQLLSGFIFPIESMPEFFRYFTMILPARWFMTIARQSFLKGSNFFDLFVPFLALSILCAVMISLALLNFKRDVEP